MLSTARKSVGGVSDPTEAMIQFETDPEQYRALAKAWAERYGEAVGMAPRGSCGGSGAAPLTTVHVPQLAGKVLAIPVNASTTLCELRTAIQNSTGMLTDTMLILKEGRVLVNNSATLFDLGVQNEDFLSLALGMSADENLVTGGTVINAVEHAVEIKYDGRVRPVSGIPCIASFPGKYAKGWNKVVDVSSGADDSVSAATVFLPKYTPKFGRHAISLATGRCLCHEMYGEEKEWGCEWAQAWQENIEEAVRWGQRLQVFFFAGMAGKGKVASWEECGQSNLKSEQLWARMGPFLEALPEGEKRRLEGLSRAKRFDSSTERGDEERRLFLQSLGAEERKHLLAQEGLGWSQKAEVAWLEKRFQETGNKGYLYEEVGVEKFLDP